MTIDISSKIYPFVPTFNPYQMLFQDMTHVVGRNRKELLAMSKENGEDKKG